MNFGPTSDPLPSPQKPEKLLACLSMWNYECHSKNDCNTNSNNIT